MKVRALMFRLLLLFLLAAPLARAHVGSKDVFQTVHAGPYVLYVTVRPPDVIPGVATVEIRSSGAPVYSIAITPLPVTGEAAKHPPAADTMVRNAQDQGFFTGTVWMMSPGAWQVRIAATGADGQETATVPVLAVPVTTLHMQRGMGIGLGLLGLLLVVGMAGVVAASVREARLVPGETPSEPRRRRAAYAMAGALVVLGGMVWLGGRWWNVEAADYAENVFRPAPTTATLSGNRLDLRVAAIESKNLRRNRLNSDYLPDHGKLMHLYAIRWPEMDAAFHLHPTLAQRGNFVDQLPAMPPGHYRLFGDVVHASGLPETLQAQIDVPAGMAGTALDAEDGSAQPAPLSAGMLGTTYKLPDGYTMVWDKPAALTADTAYSFRFTLLDPSGKPAGDMQPYLGMAGHAAWVKTDGSVFAHTHPEGSAPMADVMLADESLGNSAMSAMAVPAHVEPVVAFPYGFPTAGQYRIFIQMKHGGRVETGVFDAEVKQR